MTNFPTEPLSFNRLTKATMCERSRDFLGLLKTRRTVRDFSEEPVPMEVVWNAIRAAATAPNGANLQPWHFVVVTDTERKKAIREAAEAEERAFYSSRAPQDWLDVLAPLGTDEHKPFLTEAPVIIGVFAERSRIDEQGAKQKVYYPTESVGLATGMLISSLHLSGLATLTHTPSPMGFMNEIMERPSNERAFVLLVVGYPKAGANVPTIAKREFEEICTHLG